MVLYCLSLTEVLSLGLILVSSEVHISNTLSQIAIDDSGPPIVHYGTHVPIAVSTPTGTDIHGHSSQQEDSYQQIIPGILQVVYLSLATYSNF